MTKHYKSDLRLSIWYHLALDTRLLPSHSKKKKIKEKPVSSGDLRHQVKTLIHTS